MTGTAPDRLPFVDVLKALGAQLIVLHHLAFYGPLSDRLRPHAPDVVGWFSDHARIAVQLFLVVGGFLAARRLAPAGRLTTSRPWRLVPRRYLRLAIPCTVVLVLAVLSAEVARGWMTHESISAPPTLAQALAHLALLQDVLGFESLSAGLWYVAIDFQLFVLLLAVLWAAHRAPSAFGMTAVAALGAVSLLYFNRVPRWDVWAIYFAGAYALGAVAWWSAARAAPAWLGMALLATALAALATDYRVRIAVALLVAVALFAASRTGLLARWPRSTVVAWLGRTAYSLFLVHFPACLVVNAFWTRFLPHDPWTSAAGLAVAWAASMAAGALLYRYVEAPSGAWASRLASRGGALKRA
jgi:peptidoglycan/LPS O-acetylase OafA/YrhL